MNNQDIIDEIEKWNNILNSNSNEILFELAFFKIYIKFEKFLIEIFIHYSIGLMSSENYNPKRRLIFDDEDHLYKVIKLRQSDFLNLDSILKFAPEIFLVNPFDVLVSSNNNDYFIKMKYLRNFIAHESKESLIKYHDNVLNSKIYIEPYKYLLKKDKLLKTSYYNNFINNIKDITTYLLKGPV